MSIPLVPILSDPTEPILQDVSLLNPLSLGLDAWFDFSDTSRITASGVNVTQVIDKSGNNLIATQGVGADQPDTGVSTQNGMNVLLFNSDFLNLGQPGQLVYGQGDFSIFSIFSDFDPSGGDTLFAYGRTGTGGILYSSTIRTTLKTETDDGSDQETADSGIDPTDQGWMTACSIRRGDVLEIWQNGVLRATETLPGGYNIVPNEDALIGAVRNSSGGRTRLYNGEFAELMVTGRAFSEGENEQLHEYAVSKWAI